jgi:hypothetical protein
MMVVLLCLLVYQPKAQEALSEDAAMAALEGFFNALSVENYPNPGIKNWITEDFLIFEMGKSFSWERFQAFLDEAGYSAWTSTRWEFSEARVSLSGNSAHISYVNTGKFVYPDPANSGRALLERNVWLESAYLVTDEGGLKLKFLQSENISRTVEPYTENKKER